MLSRRDFIRLLAAAGAVVLSPLEKLVGKEHVTHASAHNFPEGELYEGFLLLPAAAPLPTTVVMPRLGIPLFCGVGAGRGGPEPNAVIHQFDSLDELKKRVTVRLYTLNNSSEELVAQDIQLISHPTDEIYAISIIYRFSGQPEESSNAGVGLWIEPDFPRPFPLWDTDSNWDITRRAEAVDFLPTPGLMKRGIQGVTFYWIEEDVLYRLNIGIELTVRQVNSLVRSLEAY